MEEVSRIRRLLEEHDRLKADFICTELSLAITFCKIALSNSNQAIADRNLQNAGRARESACHTLEGSSLEPSERQAIEEKLGQLAELLEKLDRGESAAKLAS